MLAIGTGLTVAVPAAAEISGRLSAVSEEMFRGRSISAGQPAVGLDLAYDDVGGAFAGVQARAMWRQNDGPGFLSAQGYAGYAFRLRPGVSLDVVATHTRFSLHSGFGRETGYSEVSAGLLTTRSSVRVSLSPDWLGGGNYTAYGEVAHAIDLPARWQLTAHAGVLGWLGRRPDGVSPLRYDTRLGIARSFGRLRIDGGWVFGGPKPDRYGGREHGRHSVTIGASFRL